MRFSNRTFGRTGLTSLPSLLASVVGGLAFLGALVGGERDASAADQQPPCDPASLMCSVGTASALTAQVKDRLPTQIDSGWIADGRIKVRARFTIDPVGGDPIVKVDMSRGALVEASWPEAGYINLRTVTDKQPDGKVEAHYTLAPSLEASIYGIGLSYNATELVNRIPGARFNYDARGNMKLVPWGFAGAPLRVGAPPLDQSTLFSMPFSDLGISTGLVTGTLTLQASASPIFNYATKKVLLDSAVITTADGVAKIPADDVDFIDVTASVAGEITLGGTLQVRPGAKVDTVDGYSTFGAISYSFNAADIAISGPPMPVSFGLAKIHIPLPNVKVPRTPVNVGDIKAGEQLEKTIEIDSTGELAGSLKFESSDPQFIVPTEQVQAPSKTKYQLRVICKPSNGGAASATITVRSNDPDAPEQTFMIGANGATLPLPEEESDSPEAAAKRRKGGISELPLPPSDEGCAVAHVGTRSVPGTYAAVGLGLAVAAIAHRRRPRP